MIVTIERVRTFELRNLLGWDCPQSLLDAHAACLTESTAIWLGRADGVEACAIGVIPPFLLADSAYLWMIHTPLCEQHPLRFMRWSRRVLEEVRGLYPHLRGLCHPDNASGKRWLQWLGANFDLAGNRMWNNHAIFEIK